MEIKWEYILILVIIFFVLYLLINRCGYIQKYNRIQRFSVGCPLKPKQNTDSQKYIYEKPYIGKEQPLVFVLEKICDGNTPIEEEELDYIGKVQGKEKWVKFISKREQNTRGGLTRDQAIDILYPMKMKVNRSVNIIIYTLRYNIIKLYFNNIEYIL